MRRDVPLTMKSAPPTGRRAGGRAAGRRLLVLAGIVSLVAPAAGAAAAEVTRTFPASPGGKLVLDLQTGGDVEVDGSGGSAVTVAYTASCSPDCKVDFQESGDGLRIATRFDGVARRQHAEVEIRIQVPRKFDVELSSMGGGLKLRGIEGKFTGRTAGGELVLHGVHGEAELTTMGGEITLTDSDLDGELKTMGGEVLFENVVGDVRGTSMGGNVRSRNVQRRDGGVGSPPRSDAPLDEAAGQTVQISTMGGEIDVEDAPEGAELHTMGGNIRVKDARRFVRAKTMGGDISLASVDGWINATTMGGDIEATVVGTGGDVTLTSMSGEVTLHVPPGFGMQLDLEIAFTKNSSQDYRIEAPGGLTSTVTPDWDRGQGSPRKYIRMSGPANGGGNAVRIRTINGNIRVLETR
jgi:DUF4097 and DUF4098 domain-containing protein YvlB